MSFGHGKNTKVYANGYDLGDYLSNISTPGTADVVETSVFNSSAKTYISGHKDATLSAEGFFDGDADAVDEAFNTALGSTDNVWTWYPQGDSIGSYGYGMETIKNSYEITSPIDGVVSVTAEGQSHVGRDRIVSLHAMSQESSSSGSASSVDNTSATTEGGIGYLQVEAVSGGTLAATVQHSSAGSTWSELISFTGTTGRTAERKTATGEVKRYVRAAWELSSSSATATFNIGFRRKE